MMIRFRMLYLLLLVWFSATVISGCGKSETWPLRLDSPTGSHVVQINCDANGSLIASVEDNSETVMLDSPLGLILAHGDTLGKQVELLSVKRNRGIERYEPVVGKSSRVELRWNELLLNLRESGSQLDFRLRVRSTDDGVAFRYELPSLKDGRDTVRILGERTTFRFPAGTRGWVKTVPNWNTASEYRYKDTLLCELQPDNQIGLPLLITTPDGEALLVHEAALENYAAMNLQPACDSTGAGVHVLLAPHPRESNTAVETTTPLKTPWRVLLLADHPGKLIESEMIPALNEPCRISDTRWIEPGIASWDWWSGQIVEEADFCTGSNDSTLRAYVDLAAEYRWAYTLVDAGWYGRAKDTEADITRPLPQINIPALVDYAAEKNVGILLWIHWKNTKHQMHEAFALYEKWGIKGVKIDYMNRRDQEMVQFYHDVLELAAQHHLLVNFHGAYMPTGIRRTWPNLVTREGVLGLEHVKEPGRIPYADHNLVLPYTRMVVGPMDYTPGGFRTVAPKEFVARESRPVVPTTTAHQLAMFVVYDSPLQVVADSPGAVRNAQGSEVLKEVPASWDETRFLDGEVGKSILLARRAGDVWWIGAMAGNEPFSKHFSLRRIFGDDAADSLWITKWTDGQNNNPHEVLVSSGEFSPQDTITIATPATGGVVLKVEKLQQTLRISG